MLHDTITKRAAVLSQLSSGLTALGLLDMMKAFPTCFEKVFTYDDSETVSPQSFWGLLEIPNKMTTAETQVLDMLNTFVSSCTKEGALRLTIYM